MSTVAKALSLTDHFNGDRPEIALGDMTRLSGFDKATTRRLLLSLADCGLVEQNPANKTWRIGPAALRLARLRAERFPFLEVARPVVDALSAETGESAHISELSGARLSTVYACESTRANRVGVPVGLILPFNSSASGLAVFAFAPETVRRQALARKLERATKASIMVRAKLETEAGRIRKRGYAISDQLLEEGVFSVAAPILDADGFAIGALSVAAPLARVTRATAADFGAKARAASERISAGLFGREARK